jgi:hypothetical protein
MAYPNPQNQSTFNRYYSAGQVGQVARLTPYFFDIAPNAVELVPADGVYYDANGEWIKPVDALTEPLVTHLVGFELSDNSFSIATQDNLNTAISYPADTPKVKGLANGCMFVVAGGSILKGQQLQYEFGTGKYIVNGVTGNRLNIIALEDAEVDQIFTVRVNAIA